MADYRFHTTRHEALRVSERELSVENMTRNKTWAGTHGGTVRKFRKTVEPKTLVVVAEIKGKDCWLLTGFFAD